MNGGTVNGASHSALLRAFYAAFARRDATAMADCYHPDIEFSDPVFPALRGERAKAMWRMLCERGRDLEITLGAVTADETRGKARWEARYSFSATGRRVHNAVDAAFEFRDGLIFRHRDSFDLHRWASMALGWKGSLLGGMPFMQKAIRARAELSLQRFTGAGDGPRRSP